MILPIPLFPITAPVYRSIRRASLLVGSALVLSLGACGANKPNGPTPASVHAPAPMSDTQRQLQIESFDVAWQTVRDRHWDPSFNGVDWDAAKAELRPRIETATTVPEARATISALLARLKQTHFGLIPSDAYDRLDDQKTPAADAADRSGSMGITARLIDGRALVVAVRDQSPAHAAGVRPGWIITKVDDRTFDASLAGATQQVGSQALGRAMAARAIHAALDGPVGSESSVELLDGKDRNVRLTIKRVEPPGTLESFGNLPATRVEFTSRLLPSNVGYSHLNIFLSPARVMPQFAAALKEFEKADGLVIDLRGNPGGLGVMAIGMGGYFVDQPNLKLGVMTTREGTLNFVLNPRRPRWDKPTAILVDESSLSTSEILAGGLQDLNKARVFGSPTGGAALPSQIIRLPSGDALQFAMANYVTDSGRTLEGAGVIPDEVVEPKREALREGQDPVLKAAEDWIRQASQRY